MKAIIQHKYGSPDVLELAEIDKPVAESDQVLVRVHAASVNPLDWHFMRGAPYIVRTQAGLRRPKLAIRGVDVAGTVEAVGADVTSFKPGDEVFGGSRGAYAEYVCVSEDDIALKPSNMSFEQAASVAIAAFTALQGLRDMGRIQPGQKVLINGAAGGVGTFAVQIAKSFGAEVTGVCSTRNVDMVHSIGADHVIDYTSEDFTDGGRRYDLMFDNVGNRSLSECRSVLTAEGTYVLIGGPDGRWFGPLNRLLKVLALSRFVSQNMVTVLAKRNKADLLILKDLLETGTITPVIDRKYSLCEVPEAIRYLEERHARGKVVITV